MSKYPLSCPYCGKELPNNQTPCCGEVGHGCEHENGHFVHGRTGDGTEYDQWKCNDCDFEGEPE